MFVIWRRPDGFHGAKPEDFRVIEVEHDVRLWLHKDDQLWFPFQISGGWQDEEQTKKLNKFVNLMNHSENNWSDALGQLYHETMNDDPKLFLDELDGWLDQLIKNPKGDKWEKEIIEKTISFVQKNIQASRAQFIEIVSN